MMLDEQDRRFLGALRKAESEEAEDVIPLADREQDQRLVNAVLRRIQATPPPRPRVSRAWRRALGSAGVFAMAAILLVFLLPQWLQPEYAPIPGYSVEVETDRQVLGPGEAPPAVRRLSMGSMLEVRLRPATPIKGELHAYSFVSSRGQIRPLSATFARSPQGVFSLKDRASQFPELQQGPATLVFALSRSPSPPAPARIAEWLRSGTAPSDLLLLRQELELLPQ